VNGWIDAKERLPDTEDRVLIVYRHSSGRIEKAFIGDTYYDASVGVMRWSGLPRDCEVIYWQPIPDWPRESSHSQYSKSE
jgi:hypothetical protein